MATLTNKCQIVKIQTMADGTPRLLVDLLDAKAEDLASAFKLMGHETFLSIISKEELAKQETTS